MGKSIRNGTVKSHVNNIMQKLGALLAQTAAICAQRKGLTNQDVVHRLAYSGDVAAGQLAVFPRRSEPGLAVKLSRQTKRSETERVGLLIGRKTDEKVNFICRVLSRARDVYWGLINSKEC